MAPAVGRRDRDRELEAGFLVRMQSRTGPKRGPSLKRGNEPDQDQDQDQGLPGHQDQDQDQDQGQDQDQDPVAEEDRTRTRTRTSRTNAMWLGPIEQDQERCARACPLRFVVFW